MVRSPLRWTAYLLAFIFLLASTRAAPSPVSAEVTPATLRPRTYAPASIDIKLHCQSRSPLQGTLEVQGWTSTDLVCVQQISDLVLFSGTSNQRVLLPTSLRGRAIEEVRLRFLAAGATYELGRFLTTGDMAAKRQYVIGLCRPAIGFSEPQNLAWRALRPERVLPDDRSRGVEIATTPVWFAPEDLPSPLGLCAFDLVLLEGPALAALSEKQLSELATWVEAGGSLCVVAARDLKPEHRAFLQRLSLPDDEEAMKTKPSFVRAGLGRVALIAVSPSGEDQLMSEPWTTATYHLAHSHVLNRSAAADAPTRRGYNPSNWYYEYGTFNELEQLMLQALPHSARLIPLPVLGFILCGFVLLVGPGEWILLGRLRRRAWTWVTFPVLAIGCTLFTVQIAEHYLGKEDQRASLVITDFSQQGKALRENRFDLWFAGRNKDAVSDVHQALSVPCFQRSSSGRSSQPLKPPVYQGRVPGHYTLRQPLFQWTPFIQRTLSFAPAATSTRLSWEALRDWPPNYHLNKAKIDDPESATFVSEKIGAQDWTVHVFRPRLPRNDQPSLAERLSVHPLDAWAFTRSPSGDLTLSDLFLDYQLGGMIVVAQRQVGQEVQIQRCVYHFDSHE